MKISRSLFLALTGALATGACHVYVDDPQPPPPPPRRIAYAYPAAPPAPPGTYSPSSAAAETNYYNAPRPAPPRIARRPARRVGVATHDPGYRPPPPSFGLLSPASESTGTVLAPPSTPSSPTPLVPAAPAAPPAPAAPAAEGCLDTESSAVPDCSAVRVEASCGIRSFVQQECRTYKTYMDAKVAAVAIGCMASLSPGQLCDASNTYACGKQALSEACADDELTQLCQIAAKSCRTTASDCTALLSGLSDSGKTKVAECISHGCQAGLYSCVEGLR